MKNKFYKHLVKVEPVIAKFSDIEISSEEREKLLELLHSHIHVTVIDVILSELDEVKKKEFLHLVGIREDHSGAWEFVITNIENGEEKVREAIENIILNFLNDLDEHGN